MRRLRGSGLPAVLLALVSGIAAVVPEAGHSWAHRDGHIPAVRDHVHYGDDLPEPAVVVKHGHAPGGHAHLDLRAPAPSRTSLVLAGVVHSAVALEDLNAENKPASPAIAHGLAPPQQAQAPPPPTRAPPLV